MTTSVRPTPGGEAPASQDGKPATPAVNPIKGAADAARALVKDRGITGAPVSAPEGVPPIRFQAPDPAAVAAAAALPGAEAPAGAPAGVDAGAGGDETPPAGAGGGEGDEALDEAARALAAAEAGAGGEATPDEALTVILPGPRPEDQVPIVVSDPDTAERLNQLVRGFMRGEQARAVREEAQAARDETEEFTYAVEADPIGFIAETVKDPRAIDHMVRYLLTRPGVRERLEPWLIKIVDTPDVVASEQRLVEADRITYRDEVQGTIAEKREVNQNARAILTRAHRSIEAMVPENWPVEARQQLLDDTLQDVKEFRRIRNLRMVDPRQVPALVQRRLQMFGVAPRTSKPAPAGARPTGTKGPVVPSGQTPEQLRADRTARAAAASAPIGAGSPTPSPLKVPAYDPKAKGTPIEQAARAARAAISALRGKPS